MYRDDMDGKNNTNDTLSKKTMMKMMTMSISSRMMTMWIQKTVTKNQKTTTWKMMMMMI